MTEDSVKRKLTAILCADVKGYSRMMGEDEVGTFHTLSDYPEVNYLRLKPKAWGPRIQGFEGSSEKTIPAFP